MFDLDCEMVDLRLDSFTYLSYLFVVNLFSFFFFKHKPAYERRISYWSSDVCSSDLVPHIGLPQIEPVARVIRVKPAPIGAQAMARISHSLIRQTSAIAAYTAISPNTARLIHALGTWT